jgi:hypothetical protein
LKDFICSFLANNRHQNSRTKFKIAKNFLITKKERIVVLPSTFFLSPTLQDFFINHKSIYLSTIYGFKPFMTLSYAPYKIFQTILSYTFPMPTYMDMKRHINFTFTTIFQIPCQNFHSFTIIFISFLTSFHKFPFKVMLNDHKIKMIKIIKL